jgi:pimeloyl-ACP methyl ester carboxylesterase
MREVWRSRSVARTQAGSTEEVMATSEAHATRNGDYVDTGRVRTYYEVNGSGEPLILLHGGMCTAETFDGLTPALAEHFRVYLPERRAHGRTADVSGPITYEIMAQDTIAFIEAVGIQRAHLVGWSDGALVGLLVAQWRPELVGKLVLIGQGMSWEGVGSALEPFVGQMTKELMPPELTQAYEALSPDGPDHLDAVLDKVLALWNTDPAFPLSDLERVAAPTLVLAGDDDVFLSIEHAAAMQRTLPDSQLAVVPGASHAVPLEKPELVNRLILDFLAEDQVDKRFKL